VILPPLVFPGVVAYFVSISSFWIGEGDREERKKEREGI
jgi:hypothetical protein